MNDEKNELDNLRAEVADLQRRLSEHENLRSTAIDALHGVSARTGDLEKRLHTSEKLHAAVLQGFEKAPAIEAARENGLLPKVAEVATRVRALEEAYADLRDFSVSLFETLRDITDLLRRATE